MQPSSSPIDSGAAMCGQRSSTAKMPRSVWASRTSRSPTADPAHRARRAGPRAGRRRGTPGRPARRWPGARRERRGRCGSSSPAIVAAAPGPVERPRVPSSASAGEPRRRLGAVSPAAAAGASAGRWPCTERSGSSRMASAATKARTVVTTPIWKRRDDAMLNASWMPLDDGRDERLDRGPERLRDRRPGSAPRGRRRRRRGRRARRSCVRRTGPPPCWARRRPSAASGSSSMRRVPKTVPGDAPARSSRRSGGRTSGCWSRRRAG